MWQESQIPPVVAIVTTRLPSSACKGVMRIAAFGRKGALHAKSLIGMVKIATMKGYKPAGSQT